MLNFFVNFPIAFLMVYGDCLHDVISAKYLIVKSKELCSVMVCLRGLWSYGDGLLTRTVVLQ